MHHHERIDGTGYPAGLKGDEIPLGAKIVAIADSYDAMTTNRVYRKGMSPMQAIDELQRCSDKQFDGTLIKAFIDIIIAQGLVIDGQLV